MDIEKIDFKKELKNMDALQMQELSKEIRLIDNRIQETNWTTDLIE